MDEQDYLALSLAIHSRVVEASKRRHWVTDDDIVIVVHVPEPEPEPEPEPLPEPIAPPVSGYPPRGTEHHGCASRKHGRLDMGLAQRAPWVGSTT